MAHLLARFLSVSAALGALAGCAAPPAADAGGNGAVSGQQVAAEPAFAEPGWLLLGRTEGASVYIHPRSTLRVGSSAFIMVMAAKHRPEALPGGGSVGSLRERYEIDCSRLRYRRHDGTAHPDGAALGPVLGRVGQDQWKAISPDTIMAAVSSAACTTGGAAPDAPSALPGPVLPPPHKGQRGTFRT